MEMPKMVVLLLKVRSTRGKNWRYAVRKAKIGQYAVADPGFDLENWEKIAILA